MAIVFLLALAPYFQSHRFGYVDYDDGDYVYANPVVCRGVTAEGLVWAFSKPRNANYQPVTNLSHMLDVSWFGVGRPGMMHLHNAVLHAVNAALFFWLLVVWLESGMGLKAGVTGSERPALIDNPRRMTRNLLAAALAALFWALHPLRVESVVWISSRKDVLSGFFCLVGLIAWQRNVSAYYGDTPRYTGWSLKEMLFAPAPVNGRPCKSALAVVALCFVLGYLSKPIMMVFPALLALVEWLSAGRVRWREWIGFMLGSLVFLALTFYAQAEAMEGYRVGLTGRLSMAAYALFTYLRQWVAPLGLCGFYPVNLPLPVGSVVLGGLSFLLLLLAALLCWRRFACVSFSIGWFLVALLPVSGLIPIGSALHADRYTYLPTLSMSVLLAFLLTAWPSGKRLKISALAVVLGGLCLSWAQTGYWRDTQALFERAVAVTQGNAMAYNALAEIYWRQPGQQGKAGDYWMKALGLARNCETLANVSLYLLKTDPKRRDEAYALAREALSVIPSGTADLPGAENDLGQKRAYLALGVYHLQRREWVESESYLFSANRTGLFRDDAFYWEWMGLVAYQRGKLKDSHGYLSSAFGLSPGNPRLKPMLGLVEERMARETSFP
jgi:tetratricopeptide (TPR) repeat protein